MGAIDPKRTTPLTMWTDAKHLRVAAEILNSQINDDNMRQVILPTVLLAGMSVELALKAYLYANGMDPNRLKSHFGHDLLKLREEATKFADGQAAYLLNNVKYNLEVLNPPYVAKEFQYRVIGEMQLVLPGYLCEWVTKFLAEIKAFVKERDRLHLAALAN